VRGRAFSVRRGGIPQSPPPAVPAPFGKGAFGAGTDQPAPKSPLALRTACPPPHPPPEGAGLFGQGGGIPQSPPPAVTAPFGKGAFGAETDQPAPKSPPCPKNCLPTPSSAPCGGGPFRSGGAESPSHRLRRCQPPFTRGPLERGRTSQRRKAPLALRTACPPPHPLPAGAGLFGQGGQNPPVTACGGASPLWQGGLWSGDGPASAEKPPLP